MTNLILVVSLPAPDHTRLGTHPPIPPLVSDPNSCGPFVAHQLKTQTRQHAVGSGDKKYFGSNFTATIRLKKHTHPSTQLLEDRHGTFHLMPAEACWLPASNQSGLEGRPPSRAPNRPRWLNGRQGKERNCAAVVSPSARKAH